MTGSGKIQKFKLKDLSLKLCVPNKASKSYKNGPESFFLKNRFRAGILSTNCLIYFFTIFTSNVLLSKLPLVSYASDFTVPLFGIPFSHTQCSGFQHNLCTLQVRNLHTVKLSGCSADGFISHVSCKPDTFTSFFNILRTT